MNNYDDQDPIYVESKTVFCDGGKGDLGHPGIYLNIGKAPKITCPYCGRQYSMIDRTGSGVEHWVRKPQTQKMSFWSTDPDFCFVPILA